MAVLGPLDRRKLRTRCLACTQRKIKCEGGVPCLYCVKKRQKCFAQSPVGKTKVVFVNSCAAVEDENSLSVVVSNLPLKICSTVSNKRSNLFIKHFFTAFLVKNEFGGSLDLDTIIAQFQNSSSLYHATIAVGALDLSKKNLLPSPTEARGARLGALTAYRTSIHDFQTDIKNNTIHQSNASLWTTFFLGLFELMYDDTGEGFVKHFLYGTSRILQLRGPEAHLTGPGRSFFLTVRVFEICRSLVYSEPTFLVEEGWKSMMERIWIENGRDWHPKEALFDLMVECTALSHRVWEVVNPDSSSPTTVLEDKLQELTTKGLILRQALNNWSTTFHQWSQTTSTPITTPQSLLATIYYHAISIFLSGIFDYRPQFVYINAPSLPQNIVQYHVDAILSSTERALKATSLGGVLFFFPLRVAGARVTTEEEAGRIVKMLREISKRSFVVADAFTADLTELWEHKGVGLIS